MKIRHQAASQDSLRLPLLQKLPPTVTPLGGNSIILTSWPRGVTVSTLDSESSDRGSNPREAFVISAGSDALREKLRIPILFCICRAYIASPSQGRGVHKFRASCRMRAERFFLMLPKRLFNASAKP